MTRRLLSAVLISCGASQAAANGAPDAYASEVALRDAETTAINCDYARLAGLSEPSISERFAPPDALTCASARRELSERLQAFRSAPPVAARAPTYFELLRKAFQWTPGASTSELRVPLHAPESRDRVAASRLDPWRLERAIRRRLGVATLESSGGSVDAGRSQDRLSAESEGLSGDSPQDCPSRIPSIVARLRLRLYDLNEWRSAYLEHGYECAIEAHAQLSAQLNLETFGPEAATAQASFERALASGSKGFWRQVPQGEVFAFFPFLGYDLPRVPWDSQQENLTPYELKSALEEKGAAFFVVERNTLAHREDQIQQAARNLRLFLESPASGPSGRRIVVLARSMGAMVARETLARNPDLRARVKAVVAVGGTPYGSVVAEYKSRADAFDSIYLKSRSLMIRTIGAVAAPFGPRIPSLLEEASKRGNLASLSHLAFREPSARQDETPVLNVVFTPRRLRDYFGGSSSIASGDFNFLHMSMYGPTEGSAPIARASWDTKRSLRLIYDRFSHLAFWQLPDDEALALWASVLDTAYRTGLIPER